MNIKVENENNSMAEAVVAIFDSFEDASRVAASMRQSGRRVMKLSLAEAKAGLGMPSIAYDEVGEVAPSDVMKGSVKGAAIGVAAGLAAIAVPGLNLVAPLAGGAAGAFIGSIAGVDETNRAINLPNKEDYERALLEGKSLIFMCGSDVERVEFENEMMALGAKSTHQHPPVFHAIRDTALL